QQYDDDDDDEELIGVRYPWISSGASGVSDVSALPAIWRKLFHEANVALSELGDEAVNKLILDTVLAAVSTADVSSLSTDAWKRLVDALAEALKRHRKAAGRPEVPSVGDVVTTA